MDVWIIELIVATKAQNPDCAANAALVKTIEKNHVANRGNPLLAGLAANKARKVITRWVAHGDFSPETTPRQELEAPNPEQIQTRTKTKTKTDPEPDPEPAP